MLHARGLDAAVLVATIAETRRWFWDDPARHRRERVNMLGAWQHIVEFALERLGRPAPELAAAVARDYAADDGRRCACSPTRSPA